jgi:hypothetical protein
MRFRIASYLAADSYRMTTALLEPVNGSVVEESIKDAEQVQHDDRFMQLAVTNEPMTSEQMN